MIYYLEDFNNTENINGKWKKLLEFAFREANYVEFNILFEDKELKELLSKLHSSYCGRYKEKNKLYKSGEVIRFKLTDEVKTFITLKKYENWNNYSIEDISFYKENVEVLATITHENYIIIEGDYKDNNELKEQGIKFNLLWSA